MRSDWLLKLRISFAIHLQATRINYLDVRALIGRRLSLYSAIGRNFIVREKLNEKVGCL